MTAGAWKASAGALARVRVAQASNLAQALAAYQQAGLFVVGPGRGRRRGDRAASSWPTRRWCWSSAARAAGLSRLITERCDAVARIPITGGTESLNASVAASIALYAVSRLRA